jgi:hypothetical protein
MSLQDVPWKGYRAQHNQQSRQQFFQLPARNAGLPVSCSYQDQQSSSIAIGRFSTIYLHIFGNPMRYFQKQNTPYCASPTPFCHGQQTLISWRPAQTASLLREHRDQRHLRHIRHH